MIVIARHGAEAIDDAMAVMAAAFDARFGEAWTAAQCRGVLALPGAQLLVARDERPLGFALLRTVVDEAELMLLAVTPAARGQGIGDRLLAEAAAVATAAGARALFLEVRADNHARGFYERRGLKQVGMRRSYYRGRDGIMRDSLTLCRPLS